MSATLVRCCRNCQQTVPYPGVGRPRDYCDACRPSWFPPLVVKEVPSWVSVQSERRSRRREQRDSRQRHLARAAACRAVAQLHQDEFFELYVAFCTQRGVEPCAERDA